MAPCWLPFSSFVVIFFFCTVSFFGHGPCQVDTAPCWASVLVILRFRCELGLGDLQQFLLLCVYVGF
ncbi:hypothetical protein Hanom_Chr08g00730751 [Helianthus anomalus]